VLAARCLYQAGESTSSQGQTRLARQLLEESLALYRAAHEPRGESICLTELAWSALDYGEALQALRYLEQSLRLSEQNGDVYGRAQASAVISLAWHMFYRADKIRAYAQEAHRLFTELGNAVGAGRAQLYLGTSFLVEGEWRKAEALFRQTLDRAQALQDGWAEGWGAQLLGRLMLWEQDWSAAEHWLQHAYRLRREHGEVHNQISDLAWLGRLHLARGQPAQALAYTTDAVTQLEALSGQTSVWELPDVLFGHAEALAAGQRLEEARHYLQRAHDGLLHFYQHQIDDDETRQVFLNYFLNARLLTAWRSGQFRPFPQ
jgi:tetratricopeptide (TPR) repeat protein